MKIPASFVLRVGFFLSFLLFFGFQAKAFELVCPDDVHLDCNDNIYDLGACGNAQYKDYSGWHDAGMPQVVYNLNHCDQGTITRTWTVFNPYDCVYISCSQTIYVGGTAFSEADITWPKTGLKLTSCNPDVSPSALPAGYQSPTWNNTSCAMIGSSYEDQIFYFDGACKKILRKWELINCCDYNYYTGHGVFTYYQEIDIKFTEVPVVQCPESVTAESLDCNGVEVQMEDLDLPTNACGEYAVVMHDSPYADKPGANASGTYPIGTTTVTYTIDYGCWQKTMCSVDVIVEDKTTPTPYCHYGLSVALMGMDTNDDGINDEGMVEIWAKDFDAGSFASCNSDEMLRISFSSDPTDMTRTFTCDHVGRNNIEIWVTDSKGGQNYCQTYVRVQNNGAEIENCEDNDNYSLLTGSVKAHYGDYIPEAQMQAIGVGHQGEPVEKELQIVIETVVDSVMDEEGHVILYHLELDTITKTVLDTIYPNFNEVTECNQGQYTFQELEHYHDYTIHAQADDKSRALINIADVLEIQAYINGEREFTILQKMAADVNQDKKIDETDIQILMDVLNKKTDVELDDKWRFMDIIHAYVEPSADHECEEFCKVMDFKGDTYKVNMVGYRLGDVTRDVIEASDELTPEEVLATHQLSGDLAPIDTRSIVTDFTVAPNPFREALNLSFHSTVKQQARFVLKNQLGETVYERTIKAAQGNNELQIQISNLVAGAYFYELQIGEQELKTGKLIHLR